MIFDLVKVVPEWIQVKDFGSKGKLVKLVSQMDAFSVKKAIIQNMAV